MKNGSVIKALALSTALTLVLGACGGVSNSLGLTKRPPDEFAVVQKNPLIIPPDFTLRPPQRGVAQSRTANPQEMAYRALFPEGSSLPDKSQGEIALLRESGAENASLDVRSALHEDDREAVPKGSFTREVLAASQQNGAPSITRLQPTPVGGR